MTTVNSKNYKLILTFTDGDVEIIDLKATYDVSSKLAKTSIEAQDATKLFGRILVSPEGIVQKLSLI